MAIQTPSVVEQAVAKYSGGDDAYANKLKTHIRDAMGYSNYITRMGQETAAPASIGDIKGLSPAGIKERISSSFGQQNERVNSLDRITSGIDTAAGSLASAQAARAKSARGEAGFIDPQSSDWLDKQIRDFQMNGAKGPDGVPLTVDEFKKSLLDRKAMFDSNPVGEGDMFQPGYTEKDIADRISSRFPADYIGREAYYQAIQAGATKTEASNVQDITDYTGGKMSTGRKQVFEILNPTIAKQSAELGQDSAALQEAQQKDDAGDPKFKFSEIADNHPAADKNVLAKTLYPTYKSYALNNVEDMLNDIQKDEDGNHIEGAYYKNVLKGIYQDPKGEQDSNGNIVKLGLDVVHADPEYKRIKSELVHEYSGIINEQEIGDMMDAYILK